MVVENSCKSWTMLQWQATPRRCNEIHQLFAIRTGLSNLRYFSIISIEHMNCLSIVIRYKARILKNIILRKFVIISSWNFEVIQTNMFRLVFTINLLRVCSIIMDGSLQWIPMTKRNVQLWSLVADNWSSN